MAMQGMYFTHRHKLLLQRLVAKYRDLGHTASKSAVIRSCLEERARRVLGDEATERTVTGLAEGVAWTPGPVDPLGLIDVERSANTAPVPRRFLPGGVAPPAAKGAAVPTSITLPSDLKERLQNVCAARSRSEGRRVTMSEVIRVSLAPEVAAWEHARDSAAVDV